jgi:hypothetical protein
MRATRTDAFVTTSFTDGDSPAAVVIGTVTSWADDVLRWKIRRKPLPVRSPQAA